MGAAIGEILGFAVAVAISPVPIIAVILMLFTAGARSNSVGFVSGRLIGFLLAGGVVLAIGLEASEGGASDVNGVIKILIGALFLFLGWEQWSGRPQGHEESPDAGSLLLSSRLRTGALQELLEGAGCRSRRHRD